MKTLKLWLRSALALVAGYVASALLTGLTIAALGALFPASYNPENLGWVVFNVVYGCLFAAAGGYLTAWLAPSRPVAHALVLGGLMAALAILTGVMVAASPPTPEYAAQPGWYYPVLAVTVVPSLWLGAWLRTRQVRRLAHG